MVTRRLFDVGIRIMLAASLAAAVAGIAIVHAQSNGVFSITNVDSPDPVASGQQLTYTITVVNTGGAKVSNVVLTDQVNGVGGIGAPPQLVLTSTRGSCNQNGNLVTCNAGTIEGFGSWVVTIRGVVTAANGTTLNNTAAVTGNKASQNHSATATATTLVNGGSGSPLPDLTIAKTGPTSVPVSSDMVYTLTVNNIGTANATDIKVVDTVPAGVTINMVDETSLFDCGFVGQTVTCIGGAVNQGANATITIHATSPAGTGTITNTAAVDPDNSIPEGNELNNTSALVNTQVTEGPTPPALLITKNDNPDPIVPGAILTYTIILTNNSSSRADGVLIVDGTQSLEAASITVNQVITNGALGPHDGCVVAAPEARCTAKSLDPGGFVTMTVTGQVVASAGSTIFNTATGTANIQNQLHSATDTEITTVKPAVDLTITKADSPDAVCARSWPLDEPPPAPTVCRGGLTYSFVVGNSGLTPAPNVVVRDQLPPDVIFDRVMPGGPPCVVGLGNVLTCTIANVPAESIVPFSILVVPPATTGPIVNTATVDPNNAIFEADETNNTATQTTQVITGIDLTILKTDEPPGFDPIAASGTQTYTITVDNIGTQNATNIHVRDILPAGTIFRSAQVIGPDHGFTCSHAGGIVDCVGGSLLGTASEFYDELGGLNVNDIATIRIRIFAQPNVGTMHNEVRVDPLNVIPEADETNNIDFEDTTVVTGGADKGAFNDLKIEKTGTTNTTPGGTINYSLKVSNDGTDPAVNVLVRDFLPAGTTFVSAQDSVPGPNAFSCVHSVGVINCTAATVLPGVPGERTINIVVKAPNLIVPAPGLTNQAFVDPDFAIPEGDEGNNSDTHDTVVASVINLKIKKVGPEQSSQSQVDTYTITVKNEKAQGTQGQMVTGADVHDPFPVGIIPLSVDVGQGNNWACQILENPINVMDCTGDLNPDQEITIIVTVFMTAETNRSLDNEACVDPNHEIEEFDPPGESDNCSTATTPFVPNPKSRPDLQVVKTANLATAVPGEPLTYTITITNIGNAKAKTPLTLTDDLHDLLTFTSANGTNGWTCTEASSVVTCHDDGSGLDPNASAVITIVVNVDVTASVPISNTAVADPALVDPAPSDTLENETALDNNDSTFVVSIGTAAFDLALSDIIDSPDPAIRGGVLKYTVVAVNGGTDTADDAKVAITIPASGATLLGAAGSNGFNCAAPVSGVVNCVGDLPGGGNTVITLDFIVHLTATENLTVSATIDPDDVFVEANPNNNTASEVTTVSGTGCTGTPFCVDLATVQPTGSPDPVAPGGQATYGVTVVNTGAISTADNQVNGSVELVFFDLFGDVSNVTPTATSGWTCSVVSHVAGAHLLSNCTGELGPGQSVTFSVTVTVNGGTGVTLKALADPDDTLDEVNDFQPKPPDPVVTFGNNLAIKVFKVQ